jgi:hypothetical protein
MRFGGRVETAVLVALASLAFLPASAAANGPLNPITVNESTTDAPLASTGDSQLECVSEGTSEGCTLRAAVELANYESKEYDIVVTIHLPGETFGNTSPYGTFEVEPGARIILAGAGAGETKIEGAGEAPRASIFTVDEGAALTLANLTFLHGDAETDGGNGGAVDAEGGASVTIEDAAIEDNVAEHDGGGVYGGDDSYLGEGASITIKHSTVTNNTAEWSQDAAGGDGGGVYGEPGASITIEEESTIARNTAELNGGGVSAGTGELVTNTECDFADAKTSAAHAKSDIESGSNVTPGLIVKHSKIEDNTADGDGGGGIYVSEGEEEECVREEAKVHHASTELAKPAATAAASAGAITIEQSQIEGNDAANGSGGGIAALNYEGCEQPASSSSVTILQSTVANNTAQGEDEDGDGGGIYIETQGFECDGARSAHVSKHGVKPATAALADEFGLVIEQSTLAGNRAGGDGEGSGGGIYENVESDDPIVNSTLAENIAGEGGGGIFAADEGFGLLVSDTVSDNESEGDGAGNLATDEFGELGIRNTIVTESAEETNCEGEILDGGYNLDDPSEQGGDSGSDTCGLSAAEHDLVGVEPGFEGGLGNHGGPTQTIALASTSAAIGVVPLAGDCEEVSSEGPGLLDQRGEPRPGISGDGCDIGAYEYQAGQSRPEPNVNFSLSPASEEQEAGTAHTHSVTATVTEEARSAVRSDAAPLAGASVAVTFTVSGQNAGVTGTCQTPEGDADPTCATNSEGKVVFTYPDANGAGSDTIEATALLHAETDRATAAMVWKQPKKTTTTTTVTTPAAPAASGNVLPFKAAVPPVCTSKRDITIHIQHVKQLGVVSAVVSIDGHAKRTLRGRRLTTAIDLQGLPAGTFTIEIVAHLRDGRTLTGKRVYHTCRATPLPGPSYLPL